MGIPYYFWSICKKHPAILQPVLPDQVHYLHIDFNGAIHPAVQGVIKSIAQPSAPTAAPAPEPIPQEILEGLFQEEIWASFKTIQKIANPLVETRIYIDGVAPVAKMAQQRKRRYLSHKRHELLKTTPVWDTNAISPGTQFMEQLEVFLQKKLQRVSHTHLSPASVAGEGEHKIFAFIRTLGSPAPSGRVHVIHGLDADLIMLSLISHTPGIYLMRENARDNTLDFLNIHELRIGLLREIAPQHATDPYTEEAKLWIESYILLCVLLGNDFVPHPPSLSLKKNAHEKLMHAWTQCERPLLVTSEGVIEWSALAEVITKLAGKERDLLTEYANDYLKRPPPGARSEEERMEQFPRHPQNIHQYTRLLATGTQRDLAAWRQNYYKHLFRTRMYDTKIIQDTCDAFVRGIAWTYHYYRALGLPSDFYYPYTYAPTLQDIANHIEAHAQPLTEMQMNWKRGPSLQFVSSRVQLASVLPSTSFQLLPAEIRKKLLDPAQGLSHLYPAKYPLETFLKTYLWECEPVLPFMEVKLLQKILLD